MDLFHHLPQENFPPSLQVPPVIVEDVSYRGSIVVSRRPFGAGDSHRDAWS
jgi:hypothetical protein